MEVIRLEDLKNYMKSRFLKNYGVLRQSMKIERVASWNGSEISINSDHAFKQGTSYFPGSLYLITDYIIADLDLVVTIGYNKVSPTGTFNSVTYLGKTYHDEIYTNEEAGEIEITIPAYTPRNIEIYPDTFPKNVYEITSVSVSGGRPTDRFSVVLFASNFAKFFASLKIGRLFSLFNQVRDGYFVHKKYCTLCGGTGIYDGDMCPGCSGSKIKGPNSKDYLLYLKGEALGITRKTGETDEMFAWRCHSKNWFVTPTIKEIKRATAYFVDRDADDILTTQYYSDHMPMTTVEVPRPFGPQSPWEQDKTYVFDFILSMEPGGINLIPSFYVSFYDSFRFADSLLETLIARMVRTSYLTSKINNAELFGGYYDSFLEYLSVSHETTSFEADWIDKNTDNFSVPPWDSIDAEFTLETSGKSRPFDSKLLKFAGGSGKAATRDIVDFHDDYVFTFHLNTDEDSTLYKGGLLFGDGNKYGVLFGMLAKHWGLYNSPFNFDDDDVDSYGGNYKGAYSFYDDEVGATGIDIGFVTDYGGSGTAIVEEELDYHRKILNLHEPTIFDSIYVSNNFANQASGTIEFWIRKDTTTVSTLQLKFVTTRAIYLRFTTQWGYYDGVGWNDSGTFNVDTWYHVKIDFDCSTDKFDLTVDASPVFSSADFENGVDYINLFYIDGVIGNVYIDSVDYSWESGYSGGRNKQIDVQYVKAGISYVENAYIDPDTYINVLEELDGHYKVLELQDNTLTGYVQVTNYVVKAADHIVEFYFRTMDNVSAAFFNMYEDSTKIISFYMDNGQFGYYDGSYHDIKACDNDRWYHVKVVLDDSANTFDVYMNGVLEQASAGYVNNSTTGISAIYFNTANNEKGSIYFDAIGIDGDNGYTTGDNLDFARILKTAGATVPAQGKVNDDSFDYKPLREIDKEAWYEFIIETKRTDPIPGLRRTPWNLEAYNEGDTPGEPWTVQEASNTSVTVKDYFDGHAKVFEFDDQNASGYGRITRTFNKKPNHVMEFWYRRNTINKTTFSMWEDTTQCVYFEFSNDYLSWYDGTWHSVYTINVNTWHHIKLVLDDSSSTYDIYIDGVFKETANYWNNSTLGTNKVEFGSHSTDSGYTVHFSGFGVVGEDGYKEGDNYDLERKKYYRIRAKKFGTNDLSAQKDSSMEDTQIITSGWLRYSGSINNLKFLGDGSGIFWIANARILQKRGM